MSSPSDEPSVEFRRLSPERYADFRDIADYAFHPEDGPRRYEDDRPERIAERYGVFVDDGGEKFVDDGDEGFVDDSGQEFVDADSEELVSICAHYDFTARLRDEWVPLAGLAAVATPPEHRRQGYVRHLIEESLERWRGEYPLAGLWPFERPYYAQFGWATANKSVRYSCSPEVLAFAREERAGRAKRVTADEWERLQDAHESHAADRNLTLRRDEEWWREKVFRESDDERPYVYAWERGDQIRGYVVYAFENRGGGQRDRRLDVEEIVFADRETYRALLGFLADHDSQALEVALHREEESSLLDLVEDATEVSCEVNTGPMVRVVDVKHALSTLSYPEDAVADLTLRVADDTAPWNDDIFRLQVADGDGVCSRSDAATETAADQSDEVDATVDVGTLSQLVVGYHDVDDARQVGALSIARSDAAAALADLFPPETVYQRTFY